MKKLIFSLVLFSFLSFSASAQSVNIGAKLGAGLSFQGGSDWESYMRLLDAENKTRFALTAGMFFHFEIGQTFAIQPEILCSQMGAAYNYYVPIVGTVDGTTTATAVELPILFMVRARAGRGSIRVFAGPELVFILGDVEVREEAMGLSIAMGSEPDNSFLFGIKGGVGYALPVAKAHVVIDLAYSRSFSEIFENDNTAFNCVMLTAGYQAKL